MNQNPLHRTLWTIWASMIFSIAIYGVISRVAVPQQNRQPISEALKEPVVLVLYAVAVLSFLMGIWIPRMLVKTSQPGLMPDASLTPRLMPAFIVQFAIFESIAIYGLLAAFLQQDWRLFMGPAALSVAGFLIAAPTAERIRNIAG